MTDIRDFSPSIFRTLNTPQPGSHKGQNGRLLVIGGSGLFHAASLWALTVASRIVDLVHYSSVPENNAIVTAIKTEFRNGIVVPRKDVDIYIKEDDCILIGPGMTRDAETKALTDRLLAAYPEKQWVIDAGALQMMDMSLIPRQSILTPHAKELTLLIARENDPSVDPDTLHTLEVPEDYADAALGFARRHDCIVLAKGHVDAVCSGDGCMIVPGGNGGMAKGGTGDVLAGLTAALACTNDPFTAAVCGSAINKAAGDCLYASVGPFFNATDLASEIPGTMKKLLNT